jgi:hypothetical protein
VRGKLVWVTGLSFRAQQGRMGRVNAGNTVIFVYKFFPYNDLSDLPADAEKTPPPLDSIAVTRETVWYENHETTEIIPPPPHIRAFNAVYAVVTKSKFLREAAEEIKETCRFPGTWTSAHVRRLERQNYQPEHKIDKIAFIINKSSMAAAHLENIFLAIDTKEYDVVFMGPRSELECRDRGYAEKYNCNVISINEVIERKLCYKLAVTMWGDHKSKRRIKRYGIRFIAEKTLLVSSIFDHTYGIESAEKFPYDYIACCGEYQRRLFSQYFDGKKIFLTGSPRFKAKPPAFDKKTLLLLPSYNFEVSSLRNCATIDFLHILSKLRNEYNIIIKPHPEWASCWSGCKDFFLKAIPNALFLNDIDNAKLYPAADFVICDYSNVILTTIYADKNILLFNAPRNDVAKGRILRDPVNSYLRDRIINFYPDEEEKLVAALKDDSIWEKQKEIRAQIRKEFFTENPDPARDIAELCRRIVRGEL